MATSVKIEGTPYTYEVEASAGIDLITGARWWGSLVKFRPGTSGRWQRLTLVDVHPFDHEHIEQALALYVVASAAAKAVARP